MARAREYHHRRYGVADQPCGVRAVRARARPWSGPAPARAAPPPRRAAQSPTAASCRTRVPAPGQRQHAEHDRARCEHVAAVSASPRNRIARQGEQGRGAGHRAGDGGSHALVAGVGQQRDRRRKEQADQREMRPRGIEAARIEQEGREAPEDQGRGRDAYSRAGAGDA